MRKETILAFTLLLTLVLGKKLKATSEAKAESKSEAQLVSTKMNPPTDTPETLYKLINDYRKNKANIYKQLNQDGTQFQNLAEAEVDFMIQNSKFGEFENFETNAAQFSSYTEVVCELAENHDGNAYKACLKAAYDLWMTDSSITTELKNEYTLADANCQGYGNGWICALMLATPLK